MNRFKTIQLIIFTSLSLSSVMPTVSVAMAHKRPFDKAPVREPQGRQDRSSAAKKSATRNVKQKQKMAKKPFWKSVDWEYWVAGGSVIAVIIALIWMNHNEKTVPPSKPNFRPSPAPQPNPRPAPRPRPNPRPTPNFQPSPAVPAPRPAPQPNPRPAPKPKPADPDLKIGKKECPICFVNGVANMKAPCCGQEICRKCWNHDVYSGEYDIQEHDGQIYKVRDKLPRQCPFCRADKK